MTVEEYIRFKKEQADLYNQSTGNLEDFNCEKCKNRGDFLSVNQYGDTFSTECECMNRRRMIDRAKSSGLYAVLDKYTFENYQHNEEWQSCVYDKATKFVESTANCFYVGGAIGSGKSHICTAMVGKLLEKYEVCSYLWCDLATILKQNIIEDKTTYYKVLDSVNTVTVLFIDDFFKFTPTQADLDKAFQIINYRYNLSKRDNECKTIISSEKTYAELCKIDEAIASRIAEMGNKGEFVLSIANGKNKNKRY